MNMLQLVQRLRRKCRVSGAGPSSILNQNEEYARLVDMVNEAWMELQLERPDWRWMRASMSFPTVAGQDTYTLAQIAATGAGLANFGNWDAQTFRNYVTATGTNSEVLMDPREYDDWRNLYQLGANRNTQSRPIEFSITPLHSIALGPAPAAGYTVSGDYFKVASEMTADTDIPSLPDQFHMAIVYKAMMFFGVSEAAPEVYDEGQTEFKKMLRRISMHQLPNMMQAGALA
jgi:hypothetical protein